MRRTASRAQHGTQYVDRQDPLDTRIAHFVDARLPGEPPGIVDQRIDGSQLLVDGLEQLHNLLLYRHIGANGNGRSTDRKDPFYHSISCPSVTAIVGTDRAYPRAAANAAVAAPMPRLAPVMRMALFTNLEIFSSSQRE